MRAFADTTIELSESKDGTLTVVLNGKREQADEARRRVVSLLQQQAVRELSIPKDHHRSLIGKEGRRLKELEEETNCRITVPGRDTPSQVGQMIIFACLKLCSICTDYSHYRPS